MVAFEVTNGLSDPVKSQVIQSFGESRYMISIKTIFYHVLRARFDIREETLPLLVPLVKVKNGE